MGIPLHSKIRKKIKNILDAILLFLFPAHVSHDPIPTEQIDRILVIRINYRIGNILFTTPLLRALEQRFPHAKIDIIIGAAYCVPLLKGFRSVENIFDFPRKLLKNPFNAFRYIQQLRSAQYDLVINLNTGSASDRGATFLARGTYKLGFNALNNWSPLTHVIDSPKGSIHEALKPLYLMKAFGNQPADFPQRMDIALSKEEQSKGLNDLKNRLAVQGYLWQDGVNIIGMFRDARFEKKIDDNWWNEWYTHMKQLNPNGIFVDILSPDVKEKLGENIYTLKESNLRTLGSMLSQMNLFVCGDTGPMHLASASMVPTIALFKTTTPELYGTLGNHDLSLSVGTRSASEIAQIINEHLKTIAH